MTMQSVFVLPIDRIGGPFPNRRVYFCKVTPAQLRILVPAGCRQSLTRVHVYSGFVCRLSDEATPWALSTGLHAEQYTERALISDCSANLSLVLLLMAQALGSLISDPSGQEEVLHEQQF